MLQLTSANQLKLNSGACIDATATDRELGVRALVGYHNYSGFDGAVEAVQSAVNAAGLNWRAGSCGGLGGGSMPTNAVRVGQMRVRAHDPEMILYVVPCA